MQDKHAILEPDCFYHIYNRANGNEKLFLNDKNYTYFLERFKSYILPIAEIYAYCLMPNHFHFLVRIKSENEIDDFIDKRSNHSSKTLQGFRTLEGLAKQDATSKFLTQQFSHFFNAYTQAFNKVNSRKGSLLMHPYKRKRITSETYLIKLIHYIHYNPVEAGLCSTCFDWKFSSYSAIVSAKPTLVKTMEVLELFHDLENFKSTHQKISQYEHLD